MKWNFRPSALSLSAKEKYATLTVDQLYQLYMRDNETAEQNGVPSAPSRPSNEKKGTRQLLRTCQWNVQHFQPTDKFPDVHRLATEIADRVIETDADVIVLNEFGVYVPGKSSITDSPEYGVKDFKERLELYGYSLYTSRCFFPTVIATKLPVVGPAKQFALDMNRAAVAIPVDLQCSGEGRSCDDQQQLLWIYGTHLEAGDDRNGTCRQREVVRLLERIEEDHPDTADDPPLSTLSSTQAASQNRIMVIGDFNQQRAQDYTPEEWEEICASKKRRDSPVDDGVAARLHNAGFHCVFDTNVLDNTKVQRNWPEDSPPPSTHWSGTLIDYTYFRGAGLQLAGVHVSPCNLSDHRMVICDWMVELGSD